MYFIGAFLKCNSCVGFKLTFVNVLSYGHHILAFIGQLDQGLVFSDKPDKLSYVKGWLVKMVDFVSKLFDYVIGGLSLCNNATEISFLLLDLVLQFLDSLLEKYIHRAFHL